MGGEPSELCTSCFELICVTLRRLLAYSPARKGPSSAHSAAAWLLGHTAKVLRSVSKVAGAWRSLSWCLESAMLWRGIRVFTNFGDKHVSDLDML